MQTEDLFGTPHPTGIGVRSGAVETRVPVAELLNKVLELGASDLHLAAGAQPTVRVHGALRQLEDFPVLMPNETQAMIYSILTQRQRERLESELELDCAHALPGKARFRLNVYFQRDAIGAAFRLIPQEIKPLEELGIPPRVADMARLPRGFVLVTGPTGSGKSTTLASLVDLANRDHHPPAGCTPKAGDILGPTGSIALAGGAGYTNQVGVAINNTVSDLPNGSGAAGMATMQYSNTGPTGPWQPSPAAARGPDAARHRAGDGTKQVWARFTDCNGNTSLAVISDTIVLDQTRPPAPTLTGTPGNKRIDLSWSAVTDPGASASGVASYRVYRLDQGTTTPIAVVTGTSHRDNGLTNGQAYTYWITAVDRAGNESSPESNHYTGTPS